MTSLLQSGGWGSIVKGAYRYAAIADNAPRYTVQAWMKVRIVRMSVTSKCHGYETSNEGTLFYLPLYRYAVLSCLRS